MTPLAALEHVSAREHAKHWREDRYAPDYHLLLCEDCEKALLRQLALLFRPTTIRDGPITLHGSQIMGCTFGQGTKKQCGLHDAIQEDA